MIQFGLGRGALLVLVAFSLTLGCQGGDTGSESSREDFGQVARGNLPEEMRDLVVARVADQAITLGDVQDKIAIQYGSLLELEGLDAVKQNDHILDIYVEELCWIELGKKLGLDQTPRYKKTVELARRYVLTDIVLKEYVHDRSRPSEEKVRAYYDENPDKFLVPERAIARHILTRTREAAEDARQKLLGGASWHDVASRYSLEKTTASNGGFVGAVTADGNVLGLARTPEFNAKVMSMEVGEISEPFETDKGWHIAHVEERRPEMMKPIEEVWETIEKRFVRETAFDTRQSILDSLKAALNYEKYQDALDTYMAEIITENDLLSQARRTDQDPEKKIKLYEALLRRMPESSSCPEAQFMIGFVYAEELGDEKAAREALERVLKDYPDTEMASAARRMIEGFGEGAGAVKQDEGR